MKKKTKALMLVLCAVLLVTASVLGTMAYLTSTDKVVNTFTVGKVAITLDEAKVDPDGTAVTPAERVKGNAYHLLPGHTYTKDPTVHVQANSEDSFIFVKVENGIEKYEAGTEVNPTIAKQIADCGWQPLKDDNNVDVKNVYYKTYTKSAEITNLPVFGNFTIANHADAADSWNNFSAETKVTVTAYAVQQDGFASAAAAWGETFGATHGA